MKTLYGLAIVAGLAIFAVSAFFAVNNEKMTDGPATDYLADLTLYGGIVGVVVGLGMFFGGCLMFSRKSGN